MERGVGVERCTAGRAFVQRHAGTLLNVIGQSAGCRKQVGRPGPKIWVGSDGARTCRYGKLPDPLDLTNGNCDLENPQVGQVGRSESARVGVAAAAIFLFAVAASAVLSWANGNVYRFLFGELNPLMVTAAAAFLGVAALQRLARLGWFQAEGASGRSVALTSVLGAVLTVPVIVVDLFGGFPAELNARFPASILFYPSIAVVAESAFHLVPLALMATMWRWTSLELSRARLFAIGIAALIEPVLQVVWGSEMSPTWANTYVGIHLLVFNLVALVIFRRSGFVALYTFRVGYYFIWHITWGYFRLPLLFEGGI